MDSHLDKIISKNHNQFDNWIDAINSLRKYKFSNEEISDEKNMELNDNAVSVLVKIVELFFSYGRFKDSWDYSKMSLNLYGPVLYINSLKTETKYEFGFDEDGIYLETPLIHSEYLKNMDDNFWSEFLTLSNYGKFELIESEFLPTEIEKKYFELFQTNKGSIYKIYRKFFISHIENRHDIPSFDLQVLWTPDQGIEKLVRESCIVFKKFYKLNYSLWKFYDLANKK